MATKDPARRREHNLRYYEGGGKERIIERNRANRARNKEYVRAIKAKAPCADCGKKFPPVCMDFDHLPGEEKDRNVSNLVGAGASIARLDTEIAKCEVVCANCHRIRTEDRGDY